MGWLFSGEGRGNTTKRSWIFSLLLAFSLFFGIHSAFGQAVGDYRSRANGNWDAVATWQRWVGAPTNNWVNLIAGDPYPGQNPGTGTVQILNGHTVTLNVSPANNIGALEIGANGTNGSAALNFDVNTRILTVSGKININGNNNNNIKQINVGNGTLNALGDLQLGTGSTGNGGNNDRRSHLLISTGTVNIGGDLIYTTVGGGGTNNGGVSVIFSGSGTMNLKGALRFSNNSNGTLTPSTGTVNFEGSIAQTIPIGVAAVTYNNLQINNTSAPGATLSAAITASNVTGNISVGNLTSGSIFNTGNFNIANSTGGRSITVSQNSTMNIGTSTVALGTLTLESGNISGTSGTISGNSYAVQNGSISAILAGTGSLTKTTSGTVTLSGTNTYTGTTSITAGILQLGASGVLPNSSPVSLGGGTLSTGASTGFSEAAGTLALTANSTISLGTGSHNLNFAASNAVAWTAGTNLTITGWTGTAGATGTAGKIFVGSTGTGLTAGQLGQITFQGYTQGASILASGEVVPSPAAPFITSGSTANSTYGSGNTYTITALNAPASFSASGLPTGMSIDTSTGVITIGPTTAAGVYTITISATNSNGTTNATLTYTVNKAILTITADNQTVCFGTPVATVTGAGTYTPSGFVNSETASVISGSATYTTTYTAATAAGTAGVTITPVVSGLTATNYTFTPAAGVVTILPNPVITNITTESCSASGFSVTPVNGTNGVVPSGTTYSWSAPDVTGGMTGGASGSGASSITGNLNNPTDSPQTATYTVTPVSGSCTGAPFEVVVTVNPIPAVTIMSTSICGSSGFSLTPVNGINGLVPVGTTYSWPAPVVTGGMTGGVLGSGAVNISGNLTNPTNSTQTATYTVTPTFGTCAGATFTVTVTVDPNSAITNMTNEVCTGSTFTSTPTDGVNGIVPTGTTYSWNAPTVTGGITGGAAGSGANISGTLVNPTNSPQTATYTVTPQLGGCTGATFTVVVTVNPTPIINTINTAVCSTLGFSVAPVNGTNGLVPAGTTYTWTSPSVTGGITGGAGGSGANNISGTLINPTNTPQTATYTVTPTFGTCTGATFDVVVTVNPNSSITNMTNTVCSGETFTSTPIDGTNGFVLPGTTYSWSAPIVTGGLTGGAAGSGASSITGTLNNPTDFSHTATYTVTPTIGGCNGVPFTVVVAVTPLMTASTPSSTPTVCINNVIPTITHTTTLATGIANEGVAGANGLPAGVSATLVGNEIRITGTATSSGTFNYSIPLTGGCGTVAATGTIEVSPVYALTSVRSVAPSAVGGTASITLRGDVASLPTGTYTVNYTLSGGVNTTTSTTVSIVNGVGTFPTVLITSVDLTNIVINSLRRSTDTCAATTITANNTSFFGICSTIFNSDGTFYVPDGVFEVTIRVWGGGGAGGSQFNKKGGSGGGGGGAFSQRTISTFPGDVLGVIVGKGGIAGNTPTNGGISYITRNSSQPVNTQISTSLVLANGGISAPTNMTSGAAGGALLTAPEIADRPGIISRSGGNGSATVNDKNSGGGGSSGGNANGTNAAGNAGAIAPAGGANGGDGAVEGKKASDAGEAGTSPGGGGGGGLGTKDSGLSSGGDGGDGQVIITFSCPPYVPNLPCATVIENGTSSERVIIQFNEDCEWVVPPDITEFDMLVLGGGGGGGVRSGGGGGAGGLIHARVANLGTAGVSAGSTFTVKVGNGGAGSTSQNLRGVQGNSSSIEFGTFNASAGGGGGGGSDADGNQPQRSGSAGLPNSVTLPAGFTLVSSRNFGGSGGGEGHEDKNNASAAGGGVGGGTSGGDGGDHAGGGGGGAIGAGGNSPDNNSLGGTGGGGLQTPEFGARFYAAGGGGGSQNSPAGAGGSSGAGGIGGLDGDGQIGQTPGSGGGGSGHDSKFRGGTGAKGAVIISYPIARILPVEFLRFEASCDKVERIGELNWTTAKEWENSHFEIERSVHDVKSWTKIGEVAGKGYSDAPSDYSFNDTQLPLSGGFVYYRLKQVDMSGKYSYSVTRSILVDPLAGTTYWRVFPNPNTGDPINLEMLDKQAYNDEKVTVRIISATGVFDVIEGNSPNQLSTKLSEVLKGKASGLYTIEISWATFKEYHKVILKR